MDISNIAEYIDSHIVKADSPSSTVSSTPVVESPFSFAPLEDIILMLDFYQIPQENVQDTKNIELMRMTEEIARDTKEGLLNTLMGLSSRVGGRFSGDFNKNVWAYLKILGDEKATSKRLDNIKKEIQRYENRDTI